MSDKEPERRRSRATSIEGELVRLEARVACVASRNPVRRSRDERNVESDAVMAQKTPLVPRERFWGNALVIVNEFTKQPSVLLKIGPDHPNFLVHAGLKRSVDRNLVF